VESEKAEQARKSSIENFSKDQLKHSETKEKIVLPDAQGMYAMFSHDMNLRDTGSLQGFGL